MALHSLGISEQESRQSNCKDEARTAVGSLSPCPILLLLGHTSSHTHTAHTTTTTTYARTHTPSYTWPISCIENYWEKGNNCDKKIHISIFYFIFYFTKFTWSPSRHTGERFLAARNSGLYSLLMERCPLSHRMVTIVCPGPSSLAIRTTPTQFIAEEEPTNRPLCTSAETPRCTRTGAQRKSESQQNGISANIVKLECIWSHARLPSFRSK